MPRPPRQKDAPGLLYHVMNRGARKRPIFELPRDYRAMKALLGCAAWRQRIRLHAHCLMENHFHLLAESRDGNISDTMQWIQSRYAQYFNRTRGGGGPLVGGRFVAVRVDSGAQVYGTVRYIDLNPVKAKLCKRPWDYRHGSARLHMGPGPCPRWLCRDLVRGFLDRAPASRGQPYAAAFHGAEVGAGELALVEARMRACRHADDEIDQMFEEVERGDYSRLARWTHAADGTKPGLPMADVASIRKAVAQVFPELGRLCGLQAETGLLRDLGGQGYTALARVLEVSVSTVRRRYEAHRMRMAADQTYADGTLEAAKEALLLCFGPAARRAAHVVAAYRLGGTKGV